MRLDFSAVSFFTHRSVVWPEGFNTNNDNGFMVYCEGNEKAKWDFQSPLFASSELEKYGA
jgi:hypothetical protein